MTPATAPSGLPEHPSVVRETKVLVRLLAGTMVWCGCDAAEAETQARRMLAPPDPAVTPEGADNS
jgi:hypothetical protein